MQFGSREPLTAPNHALDPFRNQIAELSLDGHAKALLATWAETIWSDTTGWFLRKRSTGAREALAWDLTFVADGEGYLYDDGMQVDFDEAFGTSVVSELESGVFTFVGETYVVTWLTGDELKHAMTVMNVEGDSWGVSLSGPTQ